MENRCVVERMSKKKKPGQSIVQNGRGGNMLEGDSFLVGKKKKGYAIFAEIGRRGGGQR